MEHFFLVTTGLICFYGVLKSADILIDSTQIFGERNPRFHGMIGYTLGALTSVPELVITMASVATGNPDIAVMNVVASNFINAIFMSIQAWRFKKLRNFKNIHFVDEMVFATLAICLPCIMFFSGVPHTINAFTGLALFIAFILWERYGNRKIIFHMEEKQRLERLYNKIAALGSTNYRLLLIMLAGVCGITVSGYFMGGAMDKLVESARDTFPVLAIIIGILAGIGTSAPEFKSFEALCRMNEENKIAFADIQSCLDNNNASSCFNYGVILPIGIFTMQLL